MEAESKAFIFDIKRDSSEDGPGIRTTVFFKGCPLSCPWCQNPEGMEPKASLSFHQQLCRPSACGAPCVRICPVGALSLDGQALKIDRALCERCGRCQEACPEQALKSIGQWMTVEELYYRVAIDKPFFRASGGGVTASGGECTMQMEFLHAFFKRLKADGIHTAIETNGLFNFERFSRLLLPWVDLIYFDLKLIDEQASIRQTGRSNRPILDNLIRLAGFDWPSLVVRVPLIPEITATGENLAGIAAFLRAHGVKCVDLLPYNPLWQDKLKELGIEPTYPRRSFMSPEEIERCMNFLH